MNFQKLTRFAIFAIIAACVIFSFGFAENQKKFTFVQMCDTQLGAGGYEHDVEAFKKAVKQINELEAEFVVICGDLVNDANGKSFADFNAIKSGFKMPCYPAPGNHDVGTQTSAAKLEAYRKLVGKDYYSFEHKGYTFIVANSSLWKNAVPSESEQHDAWIKETLTRASQKKSPVFVVGHYPMYVKNIDEAEDYTNIPVAKRKELLTLFKDHGVAAYLAGHTHTRVINDYEGIQLVNGETTSMKFDASDFGFRLWSVTPESITHEPIALKP